MIATGNVPQKQPNSRNQPSGNKAREAKKEKFPYICSKFHRFSHKTVNCSSEVTAGQCLSRIILCDAE